MTRRPGPLAALAVVALIGAGAGCSNDSSNDAANNNGAANSSDAANASADNQEQAVKFAECMRENGVSDFPDPNASGASEYGVSVRPAVFTAAVRACKDLKPPGALSAERTTEQQSAALEFAQCVRDNGVPEFPDPANGEPLVDTTQIPGPDTPEFMTILNAAMDKCGDLVEASMAEGQ
jgi:hypothetical protein